MNKYQYATILAGGLLATAACGRPATTPAPTPVPTRAGANTTAEAAPSTAPAATPAPAPAAQNPSPMQERTRLHDRLVAPRRPDAGVNVSIDSLLSKPIDVFVPQRALTTDSAALLIHFMGATWLPRHAVAGLKQPLVVAAVYLGAGSAVYARPFANDSTLYARMLDTIRARLAHVTGAPRITKVYLSGFSAGYGAIREIVRRSENLPRVDGVLLLDGIHTGYLPENKPVADGGVLDTNGLAPFAAFARRAVAGEKAFVITHSEIFPGTFASTTECTDWLLDQLQLKRTPVLEWGPMGAQQLSRTVQGRFEVLGFAGNTGPDHLDHFHGMAAFVERLLGK